MEKLAATDRILIGGSHMDITICKHDLCVVYIYIYRNTRNTHKILSIIVILMCYN
jgi:hypothetical protein